MLLQRSQAVWKPLCQFKFPFHTFLFVEQADAQSQTIVWFPAVLGGKIKKGLRQAGIVVFIGKPGLQPFSDNRFGSADRHYAATVGQIQRKRQKKGEINFAVPILQGRLPAAHDEKASVPNKANIFSCSLSTSQPENAWWKSAKKLSLPLSNKISESGDVCNR